MRFKPIWLIIIIFTAVSPHNLKAGVVNGTISENTTWSVSDSPFLIEGVVDVRRNVILTIYPGVTIKFGQDAGLQIDGHIIAMGTEKDSIRFTSAENDTAGSWDGIMLNGTTEEPAWTKEGEYTGIGSILRYCVIEYAGRGFMALGSALAINSSSPLIEHTRIVNCAGETGTIRCGNLAHTLIKNCTIVGNNSIRGGAVSLGVGSKTVIQNNVFAYNAAEDNGGAIYLAIAEADIIGNIFVKNKAGGHGGVLFAAVSKHLLIKGNSMLGNSADFDSPGLYFTGKVQADITENLFEISHNAIYLQGAVLDVNAVSNYWGRPDKHDFRSAFRDRNMDSAEPFVFYKPMLWAPPSELPTNPITVSKIILSRNDDYEDEIPRGVAEGAPLRIRLEGEDIDPIIKDVIQVRVVSTLDIDGILLPLYETEISSGTYIGRGSVALKSDQTLYTIGDDIGGSITIFAPFADSVRAEYATMSAKPLIEKYSITNVSDIQHLVDHTPSFDWLYFEIIERPQTHYRFKIYGTDASGNILSDPIWDTGEFASNDSELEYTGPALGDGLSYIGRLELYSSYLWSDPSDLPFRLNSLPQSPVPDKPDSDWLSNTKTPQLSVHISEDGENDDLVYSFEIYSANDLSSPVQSIDSIVPSESNAIWTPTEDLTENEEFDFRARAVDPFEKGPWGESRVFWINSIEEPPGAFRLASPINSEITYHLHPLLTWSEAIDPDPLSSVTYRLELSKSEDLSNPVVYTDIEQTNFTIPDSLDNRTIYYWRTTSIDNTGLETIADSSESFYVDTTPSIPIIIAPLTGEERLPTAALSWERSSDPDPNDVINYDIQLFETANMQKLIAQGYGWGRTDIRVEELDGWEALVDNQVYYWQLRSRDNHNADSKYGDVGSFFFNKLNDNPNPVTSVNTPPDTVMGTSEISFTWGAASDIDQSDTPQSLVYELEAVIGKFDSGNVRKFLSQVGTTGLTIPLDDNRLWRYRVRSRDNEGAVSTWSAEKSVLINVAEDHPEPFNNYLPSNSAAIFELDSIKFKWEASRDRDWESTVRYRLELTPSDGKKIVLNTDLTEYTYYGGLANELNYTWSVVAIDNLNLETKSNNSFYFHTNTTPTTPTAAQMEAELLPTGLISFYGSNDPNPQDRLTYILEVAVEDQFGQSLIHIENLAHSTTSINTIIGNLSGQNKLEDDTDYYFRACAVDNHGYHGSFSLPAKFRFNRENDAPEMPGMPLSPRDDDVVRSQLPLLSWNMATDVDLSDPSEKLSYDVRLDSDGELNQNSRYEFTTIPGVTQYTIPLSLDDNRPWVWQVRTRDDENAVSEWSSQVSCLINVREDAPTSSALISPSSGQKLNILGPISFNWNASTDIDYQSSIEYRFEYDTSPAFGNPQNIENIDGLTTTIDEPLSNTTYYWRIVAVDNTGLETVSSPSNFTLDTRPSIPVVSLPLTGTELLPNGTLSWLASSDPNPSDLITYTIQIGIGSVGLVGSSEKTVVRENISSTSISLANAGWIANEIAVAFGDNITCHWRIKATDNHGIESAWSAASEFVLNAVNDQPARVQNVISPAEYQEVTSVVLSWEPVTDPDFTDTPDKISYRVELSRDMGFSLDVITNQTSPGITSFTPANLVDNSEWYWLITAIDDEGLGGSVSNIFSFIYNTKNDDPKAFSLRVPKMDSKFDTTSISFSWSKALDPDPDDKVIYTLFVAKDASFTVALKKYSGLRSTQFTPPHSDFNSDGTYFWKVSAEDGEGGSVWSGGNGSSPWIFTVHLPQPKPPSPPASGGP